MDEKKSLVISAVEKNLLHASKKLIFKERVWGMLVDDKLKVDPLHYSLYDVFMIAKEFPKKVLWIVSDTCICYYTDGSREVKTCETSAYCNTYYVENVAAKDCSGKQRFVDIKKIKNLYKDNRAYFEKLEKKYPNKNLRFWTNAEFTGWSLAMSLAGKKCYGFQFQNVLYNFDDGN